MSEENVVVEDVKVEDILVEEKESDVVSIDATPEEMAGLQEYMDRLRNMPQCAKRLEGESFEDYKTRRRIVNKSHRRYLQGHIIWDSKKNGQWPGNDVYEAYKTTQVNQNQMKS